MDVGPIGDLWLFCENVIFSSKLVELSGIDFFIFWKQLLPLITSQCIKPIRLVRDLMFIIICNI